MLTKIHGKYEVRHFCDYGGRYMAVAPSGRLYPCQRTVGEDADEAMCLGDVRQGIKRDLQRHFMQCQGKCSPECSRCVLKPRCRNWCNCVNYAVGGDILQTPAIVCFHERLAIEVADSVASTLYAEKNPLFMRTFYREDTAWHDWK
jgi:radical SAM protein with 4Fe4S-binding SPASM domain